jgi:NTP pyrophosphatase (non-canonical NTP hydrolase)
MYYIYHIPGQKIGVTRDLNKRVTVTQGYKEGEYEVLDSSDDINYISDKELELQMLYGYKIDRKLYKNLFKNKDKTKKMLPRATEATTTFPCPVAKLKGRLMDLDGLNWTTPQGYEFEINKETTKWIVKNAKPSMYGKENCYIYNKAFYEAFNQEPESDNVFENIRRWAGDRGIYLKGSSQVQFVKLMEEVGELAQAILQDNQDDQKDAIGDIIVVLTNLAEMMGLKVEECIDFAYEQIKDRKGQMVNGTFVKNETYPLNTTDHWKKVTL